MKFVHLGMLFGIAAVAAFFSNPSFGRDQSDGCGLGWEVTSKTTFSATTTRATTNVFVPPTFGMTTGTLGCAQHSIVKKEDEAAAVYAVENYDSLRQEMAEGNGENLRAFAGLLGCGGSYDSFARMAREHYSTIATQGPDQLSLFVNTRTEIDREPALAAACRI